MDKIERDEKIKQDIKCGLEACDIAEQYSLVPGSIHTIARQEHKAIKKEVDQIHQSMEDEIKKCRFEYGYTIPELSKAFGITNGAAIRLVGKDDVFKKFSDRFQISFGERTVTLCGKY